MWDGPVGMRPLLRSSRLNGRRGENVYLFELKFHRYINSLYIHLGLYALFIGTCIATRILLVRRNKAKELAQTDQYGVVVNTNSHAFDDLTDLQNPDFRYSI